MISVSEIPAHLRFYIDVPVDILRDFLKNGKHLKYSSPEYENLPLPMWKRGESIHIKKIVKGKESGSLITSMQPLHCPTKEDWIELDESWIDEKRPPRFSPDSPPKKEKYFKCCKYFGAHYFLCTKK